MSKVSVPGEDGKWYGVRLVFRSLSDGETGSLYEERITLWRADSMNDAIVLAEREAEEYTSALDEHPHFEYLGLAQAFHTFIPDRPIESGDEVFSLMRESSLEAGEYVQTFFSTGAEVQSILGVEDATEPQR